MVLPVFQLMTRRSTISSSNNSNRPIFTSIPTSSGRSHPSRIGANYKNFWNVFRSSPELVATLSIPIIDIIGDRPEWTAPDGSPLGRNKLMEAQRFWRNNRGKETVRAWLFDAFLTGDGYMWLGTPTKKEKMIAVKEALKKSNYFLSKLQTKELFVKSVQDEDLKKPKKFDYVASSTVKIIHDEFEIKGYEQDSNGKNSKFSPQDIIHYRYLTINGMVDGFAPVQALAAEILLLSLVKGNMIAFMRNGGTPDKVFVLPKEMAKSKNHQYLIQQLRKYKKIQTSHGNLVFTGDLNIQDLQGSPKDLEYKDLALYITSNIAFAYGIPVTRIPYLIGTSANKGDAGGLSESGYWNKISDTQDSVEDLLNSQLFEPLGWAIKFTRKYKQDEVRDAQTNSMNADTITKYQTILSKNDQQPTLTKVLKMLKFTQEDVEEFKPSIEMENNLNGQNQLGNDQTQPEPDKQKKNQTKRNAANKKSVKEAAFNP